MKIKTIVGISFSVIAIAVAAFFYCKKAADLPIPKSKYTLCDIKVDSFQVYRADSIIKGKMMFSPLERNKIWVINGRGQRSAELDLNTYQWTSMVQKYGDWFRHINGKINVIEDEFENNAWIHSGFLNKGIWKYNKYNKQYKEIKGYIHNVVPDKDAIWLTYDNFIMRLDRKTEIIDTLKDIPLGYISTLSLGNPQKNELILNNTHRFNYKTKNYELIQDGNMPDCHRPANVQCSFSLPSQYSFDSYSPINTCDNEKTWAIKKNELYSSLNEDPNQILGYFWNYNQQPRQALSDDENLYILYERDFVIINKDFLAKKSYDFNKIIEKIKHCRKLRDSIGVYTDTIYESFLAKIATYNQAAQGIDIRLINVDVTSMKYHFSSIIAQKYALQLLERKDVDTTVQINIYRRFIAEEVLKGNFKKAIFFWEKYQAKLPRTFMPPYYRNNCELIRTTQLKLDSLEQQILPEEELLWFKGNAIKQLCCNSEWFAGNLFYNTELADRLHQKLVKLYPQSQYADNIVYESIMLVHHPGCGDYEYSDELNRDLKKFCETYPDSEHWAEAANFRAEMYYTASEEYNHVKKQYEKANVIYQEVLNRFPDNKEAKEGARRSQAMNDCQSLQLVMTSNHKEIVPNGKVKITFTIKNPTNRTINLPLYKDKVLSNFRLQVMQYQRNGCQYDPNIDAPSISIDAKKYNWDTYDYALAPKSNYTETLELTELVSNERQGLAKFIFSQKDNYTISARYIFPTVDYERATLSSNTLNLLVK